MEANPEVPLRIYGHFGIPTDLEFLRHFPFLKGFQADLFDLTSLAGLEHLPSSLEFLGLAATRRRFSLKALSRFKSLRDLYLEGHDKDFSAVGELSELTSLTLRSITLPTLSVLTALTDLRSLVLRLGGSRDLAFLPSIGKLRYLELWMIRGLTDISAVGELPALRYLFLQDLKNVSVVPSLAPLVNLERCDIDSLKTLTDLAPIAKAPNLRELVVVRMRHLNVDSFDCFRNHPALGAATIDMESRKKNDAVDRLLALPRVSELKPTQRYVAD